MTGVYMRKISILLLLLLAVGTLSARDLKIGIVDSQAILTSFEEYQNAMGVLQEEKNEWDRKLADLEQKMTQADQDYQAQQSVMGPAVKASREAEMQKMYTDYKQMQEDVYSEPNGKLYKRNEQLISPIIDKINDAIKTVAQDNGFDMIIDNAATPMSVVVYLSDTAADVNITDRVLESLKATP